MLGYLVRRILLIIPTLILTSILIFFLVQLPPGDFLTYKIMELRESGDASAIAEVAALREIYGLDKPFLVQYFRWLTGFLNGNFGYSFEWEKPVAEVIGNRLTLTMIISISTIIFTWITALPIGIYSATHQYSPGDYVFTFLGFVGMATPGFLLALLLLFLSFSTLGQSVGGLFSPEFISAAWFSSDYPYFNWAKLWDFLKHLWIPVVVIGVAGTAGMIRVMRGNLLDELRKQYVTTARSKGLSERRLLVKYPVRMALNPFVSGIGGLFPALISGSTIVSVVLALPTTGPMLLNALMSQDMYLAGTFLMFLSILTVFGYLISDILLAWLDPRIRYE